ncbi:MAG: hypothetical protein JXR59_08605 [Desulfuromonadaceae bacterium]|nr:hypothetical protein [Desulfuromonadaceae bacterium]
MSNSNGNARLFVEASPDDAPPELIHDLATCGQLDAYSLRQRLKGHQLAMLAKGPEHRLQTMADRLRQHNRQHWLFTPTPAAFAPETINGLELRAEQIIFQCREKKIVLEAGQPVIAILADLSGQLVEKGLKRLLVRNVYGHSGHGTPLPAEELEEEIFRYSPILDLYWLDETGQPDHGVRILPGRFDHRQLGDAASLSRNRNLQNLLQLIREKVSPLPLYSGLGLSFLPDCAISPVAGDEAYHSKHNLAALTAYGWLMADILQLRHKNQDSDRLATPLLGPAVEGLESLTEILSNAEGPHPPQPSQATTPSMPPLPPPPAAESQSGIGLHLKGGRLFMLAAAIGLSIATNLSHNGPQWFLHDAVGSGLVQGLAATLCFIAGFYHLSLKRHIQNTPTSRIRSVAMGLVEIHGRAKRLYAVVSPVTHLPCVYYCLKRYRRGGKDNQWQLISVASSGHVPFALEDDTGTIQIDPTGATLKVKSVNEGKSGEGSLLFGNMDNNPNEKWVEEVLYEGAYLYVMGFAHRRQHGPNRSEQLRDRLSQLKSDPQRIRKYDRNGDGQIDASEWDEARRDMEQQLLHETLTRKGKTDETLVIGKPPRKRLPYLIAETASEAHLTFNYNLIIVPLLTGGLGLAIWAIIRAARFFHLF